MNEISTRNEKEVTSVCDQSQKLFQVEKEKMTEYTVTEDMKETIIRLNKEIIRLKTDLCCLQELHKGYVMKMQKSFQDAMKLLSTNMIKILVPTARLKTGLFDKIVQSEECNNDVVKTCDTTENKSREEKITEQPKIVPKNTENSNQELIPENLDDSDHESYLITENMDQEHDNDLEYIDNSKQDPDYVPENMNDSDNESYFITENMDQEHDNDLEYIDDSNQDPDYVPENMDDSDNESCLIIDIVDQEHDNDLEHIDNSNQDYVPEDMDDSNLESGFVIDVIDNRDQEPDFVSENLENSDKEYDVVTQDMHVEDKEQRNSSLHQDMNDNDQEPESCQENSEQEPDSSQENMELLTDRFNHPAGTDHIYFMRQSVDHSYCLSNIKTDIRLKTGPDSYRMPSLKDKLKSLLLPLPNITEDGKIVPGKTQIATEDGDIEESLCLEKTHVIGELIQKPSREKRKPFIKGGIFIPLERTVDHQHPVPVQVFQNAALKLSENQKMPIDASDTNNLASNSDVDVKGKNEPKQRSPTVNSLPGNSQSSTENNLSGKNYYLVIKHQEGFKVVKQLKAPMNQNVQNPLNQNEQNPMNQNVQNPLNQNVQKPSKKKRVKNKTETINPLTGKPYQIIRPKPGSGVPEDSPDIEESENNELPIKIEKPIPQRTDSKICYICGKYFEKKKSMYTHLRTHGEKLNQCDKCDKSFVRKKHLDEHKTIHDNIKNFTCELCGMSVRHYSSFRKHQKRHENDYGANCDICHKQYMCKGDMLKHRSLHETEPKFKCSICKAKFRTKRRLDAHMKEHNERPFECLDCDEICADADSLTKHTLGHFDALPYGCGTCGKAFKKPEHLTKHVQQHVCRKAYSYKCYECGFSLRTKSSFEEHQQRNHGISVTCQDCGQSFPTVTERDNHVDTHSLNRPNLVFGCSYCHKGFAKADHLKFHVQMKHSINEKQTN